MALAVLAASDTDDEARKGEKRPGAFRTISEVAEDVGVHQHVLRFWESRFAQIRPLKRAGGRRFYRPDDIDLIKGIQHLLHGHGYTIKGAQRVLKDNGVRFVQAIGRGEAEAGKPSVQDQEPDGEAELIEAASDIDTVLRDVISELQACREALGSLRHDL